MTNRQNPIPVSLILAALLALLGTAAAGDIPRLPRLAAAPDGTLFGGCQVERGGNGEFELYRFGDGAAVRLGRFNGRLAGVAAAPDGRLFALTRDGSLAVHGDDSAMMANPDDRWTMRDLAWHGGGPIAVDHDGRQIRLVRPADPMTWGEAEAIAVDDNAAHIALAPLGDDLHVLWNAYARDLSRGALRHMSLHDGAWTEHDPIPLGDTGLFTAFAKGGDLVLAALIPPLLDDGDVRIEALAWRDGAWTRDPGLADSLSRTLSDPYGLAGVAPAGREAFFTVDNGGLALVRLDGKRHAAVTRVIPAAEPGLLSGDTSALTSLALMAGFVLLILLYCRRSRQMSLAMPGRPPDLISRAAALAVDWMLVSIAMTAYHVAAGDLRIYSELMTLGAVNELFWLTLGALALFCAVMEALYGATPGKRLAGLRVRSVLGGPPTMFQALFRNVLRGIDMFPVVIPGALGAVTAAFNPRRQRLGDMLAATMVRRHAPLAKRSFLLASASPRRRELLEALGHAVRVEPAEIDEDAIRGETPEATARLLAEAKLKASMENVASPTEILVAADTIVVLDDRTLGKPRDAQEAVDMLTSLSGRSHRVITGVSIWDPATGQGLSDIEETEVELRDLSSREIYDYVATGDPLDKAGAYGVQSAFLVKQIRGSLSNVAGLPMEMVRGMLSLLDS